MNKIPEDNAESLEIDFNLTNMIVDYKERQRDRILTKLREHLREKFVSHNHNKHDDGSDEDEHPTI